MPHQPGHSLGIQVAVFTVMKKLAFLVLCLTSACQLSLKSTKDNRNGDGRGSSDVCAVGQVFGGTNPDGEIACWVTNAGGCLLRGDDGACYNYCYDDGVLVKETDALGTITFRVYEPAEYEISKTIIIYNRDANTADGQDGHYSDCLLYTSPSPRDATLSRMPSSA